MKKIIFAGVAVLYLLSCIEETEKKHSSALSKKNALRDKYKASITENPGAEKLYKMHCTGCHPAPSELGLPLPSKLTPAPRDFIRDGFKYGDSITEIERNIREGVPGTAMPGFDKNLKPAEIKALANFVRSMHSLYAFDVRGY